MNGNKIAAEWQAALMDQEGFFATIIQSYLQKAIEIEFNKFIKADKYERTDGRKGHRNGSYERLINTRVGTIMLHVCRDRDGEFSTDLFRKYQRSEKALVLAITEMYFAGVSTRKVGNVMQELCGFEVSKSQVSELTSELEDGLSQWRERKLTEKYRYLVFDARYEKIRENGRIVSKAVVIVIGINNKGIREVIGNWLVNSESGEAWDSCIQSLKERGLSGVEFAVSDENKGLRKALQKHFQGVLSQRCQVHFMHNFISKLAKSEQGGAIMLLKDVFSATTKKDAMERLEKVKAFMETRKKPHVIRWLEENIEEALVVLELPFEHRKKMKSTNMLERLNQEIKRRSKVIRIFPNESSCLRLVTSLCQETSENWSNRIYLTMEAI